MMRQLLDFSRTMGRFFFVQIVNQVSKLDPIKTFKKLCKIEQGYSETLI